MDEKEIKGSKILLVEDEEALAVGLEFNLTEEGYSVVRAEDGQKALDIFENQQFDLIILDIMLPFHDGFEIASIVRSKDPQLPILMLTAKSAPEDLVHGLALGADDYLTKPFHLEELLARVRGMLRRKMWYKTTSEIPAIYHFGDNEVNFENFSATNKSGNFQLTMHEAMLLKYLIENKNKVVSRKELLANVWNITSEVDTRTVDNFVARLRKYFEPNPAKPIYFKSIRSAGYMYRENK